MLTVVAWLREQAGEEDQMLSIEKNTGMEYASPLCKHIYYVTLKIL